ncbi:hypothetical protein OS493_004181 [Desmophyllum pertusum]|uniref:Hexosyltransferase n=1 Tax=Desmophyllum pertusum TaxID=174260 RepID=A0A9W9ZSU2_9CNID|nr:hypothetical protein OS493_004181 [Desmophyllum pertusum]
MLSHRKKITCLLLAALGLLGMHLLVLLHSSSFTSSSDSTQFARTALEIELELAKTVVLPYLNQESQREPFKHRTALRTTTACRQYYFLLILVSSSPANFKRRNDIRKTWADDDTARLRPRWKTAFLVAQTQIIQDSDLLIKENEDHSDLIRADYYDSYWNQTLKILMGFEWTVRYCSFSFLLKADDDVFVNVPKLISFLNAPTTQTEKLYTGRLHKKPDVQRNGKWKVSKEEYSEKNYPSHCSGFAFVLSYDVVALFVEVFEMIPYFRIDDVYVGILADKTGIIPVHNEGFEVSRENLCIPFDNTLVRHGMVDECLAEIFNRTKESK